MSQKKKSSEQDPRTRERLLEAAVDVFGRHGFDAATTRMIAEDAAANIAAIPYYFSGKEGLYQAVVSHIVEIIDARLSPILKEMEGRTAPLAADESLALLEILLGRIIEFMVGSDDGTRFARIILREHLFPSSAYDIIFDRLMGPMISTIAALIGRVSGEASPRKVKLRAAAVMGQIMAFRVAREAMVRGLGMEGYSSEEVAEIREVILEQTRATLGRPCNGGSTGITREENS